MRTAHNEREGSVMASDRGVWGRANVSPQDWIGILEFHLSLTIRKKTITLRDCVDWLSAHGVASEASSISRLKNIKSLTAKITYYQSLILNCIIKNIPFRSIVLFFEERTYNCLRFFMPAGNPNRVQSSFVPKGIYKSTRYSFSYPGKILISIFSFYQNDKKSERLFGYGDSISVDEDQKPSNILRFKEIRVLNPSNNFFYKIFSGGFVLYDRGGFVVFGASYEVHKDISEKDIRIEDVMHVHQVMYYLEDDNNPFLIKGIKPTMLRGIRKPAAAKFIMEKVTELDFSDWDSVSKENSDIGLFERNHFSEERIKYLDGCLLGGIDQEFNMYVVR